MFIKNVSYHPLGLLPTAADSINFITPETLSHTVYDHLYIDPRDTIKLWYLPTNGIDNVSEVNCT